MGYHSLTFSERLSIESMLKEGKKVAEISAEIGCHRATVYREIERGTLNGSYSAAYSQSTLNNSKNAK